MRVVYILWLREVKKYLRSRTQIVASLGSPIMYLGILGFGLGRSSSARARGVTCSSWRRASSG